MWRKIRNFAPKRARSQAAPQQLKYISLRSVCTDFISQKLILKIIGIPVNINKLLYGKVVEWERLDFKRGWNPEDVMHSACAFANDIHNWGGGYIIVGVEEENGMPVLPPQGVALEKLDDIQKELVKLCNMIQPVCNVISKPVEVDGKMVLLLWKPPVGC